MSCSTCGRENPAHLTFCQECGQRLGPRIAPPTPPIGLGGQDAYGPPPVAAHAASPRAATSLGMSNVRDAAPAGPQASAGDRRCKVCDTVNAPNLRYCTSCGSTLDAAAVAVAQQAAPAPAPLAPVAPGPIASPINPIAPMGVVSLAGAARPEATRTCSRCKGTAEASAQFCKFCGNSLGDGAPVASPERVDFPRPSGPNGANGSSVQQGFAARPAAAPQGPIPSASPIGPSANRPAPVERAPSNYGPPPQVSAAPAAAIQAREAPRPLSAPPPAVAPAASTQRGRLVVIAKSGADGPSYPFGDLVDIGRTEGNVVVGEDPYLSPRHVRVLWNNGRLILRDLGSTNGVYLRLAPSRDANPRRTAENAEIMVPLVDQDLILVGQQVLRFDILKEGEAGLGPAQEHGTLLFGSPAAPRYARLSQRTVEGIARDVYYIRKVETVLGRESGDVVFTEDPFLSRRHVAIRLLSRDGSPAAANRPPAQGEVRFGLVDLGSSNGTFLRVRSDVEIHPGDHFRVGQQLFRVDFDGARG